MIGLTARDVLLVLDQKHDICTVLGKQFTISTVTLNCSCGMLIIRSDDFLAARGVTMKQARKALQNVPETILEVRSRHRTSLENRVGSRTSRTSQ